MPKFSCLDTATGEVLFTGVSEIPTAFVEAGRTVILEVAPENSYRLGNTWVTIPTKPSVHHVWDWPTKTWVDPRTLSELKQYRVNLAKIARDGVLYGGFTWDGSVFDSDSESQSRLLGLSVKAERDPGTVETWRLQNNTWRTLNATEIGQVWAVFEQHMRDCFLTFAILEAQIMAATSPEQLELLLWPT